MRIIFISITLMIVCGSFAQAPTTLTFESANQAYEKADYKAAAEGYERVLADGFHAEGIYYNLGNTYYKSGHLGKAILNYERALLFDPDDEHTLYNLAIASAKVQGEIDPVPSFFLRSWWRAVRNTFTSNIWGGLALLLFWMGVGGLSLWQLGQNRSHKKRGFVLGIVLLGVSFLPLTLAWNSYQHQSNSNEGILIAKTAYLKSGADEASQEVRSIYEGTRLELLDQISIWTKVRLENGEIGWLAGDTFEEI